MSKKLLMFVILRLRSAFYKSKYTIDINEANIGKIVVSHELL